VLPIAHRRVGFRKDANGKKDGFRVHSAAGLSSAAYILDADNNRIRKLPL
jgi:hypothetical protein